MVPHRFIASLLLLAGVPSGLLVIRMVASDSFRYGFMFWNLFLAVVPLMLAWWLTHRVKSHGWRQWQQAVLAFVWVVFLPNSFYLITDLMHVRQNFEADLLFDITMMTGFVFAGAVFGYASVYLVRAALPKKITEIKVYTMAAVLFLAVSFAICLGRYTRWNTWDILLQPAGLLFDVSDKLINPGLHAQTYQTTATLFLVLFAAYAAIYESIRLTRHR